MPAWLTWKVFWKVAPYLGAVLLVAGAVWYIDHRGYKRAEAEAIARDNQRKLDLAEFERVIARKVDSIQDSMQKAIERSDLRVVDTLNNLELTNRTIIQPTLTREIQRETRLSDPSFGITDVMRTEINRARSFSEQRPCPAGSNAVACFSLPDAQPTE